MQTKIILALFCTIAVCLITVNDGAPAKSKTATTPVKTTAAVAVTPAPPGSRSAWTTKIDAKSKKLFNDYKKIIAKKLQAVHKVPPKYKAKPVKTAFQVVSGFLYHYLVKIPSNKYAYVTIAHRDWVKDKYGSEENVTVRPQLYALTDKNI